MMDDWRDCFTDPPGVCVPCAVRNENDPAALPTIWIWQPFLSAWIDARGYTDRLEGHIYHQLPGYEGDE